VSIAFRIPRTDDPEAFEARLRAAGLVGGRFQVMSRELDELWKQFVGGEVDKLLEFK
jgi:hypothetical protein